jgi:hypothetical protein
VTLGGTASSVTFSSIPATYRDLILVTNVKNGTLGTVSNLLFRFNSDTGSNYSRVLMQGDGSTTVSIADTSTSLAAGVSSGSSSTEFAPSVIQIMDYSATDKHTTVISRRNSSADAVSALAGRWANTAAITTIGILPFDGNFATGSTFSLYGVIA